MLPFVAIDVLLAVVTWWHGGILLMFIVVRLLDPYVGPALVGIVAVVQTVVGLSTTLLALILVAVAGVRAGQERSYDVGDTGSSAGEGTRVRRSSP